MQALRLMVMCLLQPLFASRISLVQPSNKQTRSIKVDPIVSLQGRTIVVTGAGQGIGKGIVELAIELGANVVAVDLNGQTLDAAVSPLPQARVCSARQRGRPGCGRSCGYRSGCQVRRCARPREQRRHHPPAMIDKMTDQQWQGGDRRAPHRFFLLDACHRPSAWSSGPRAAKGRAARSSTSRPTPGARARSARSTTQQPRPACWA